MTTAIPATRTPIRIPNAVQHAHAYAYGYLRGAISNLAKSAEYSSDSRIREEIESLTRMVAELDAEIERKS